MANTIIMYGVAFDEVDFINLVDIAACAPIEIAKGFGPQLEKCFEGTIHRARAAAAAARELAEAEKPNQGE